MLQRERKSERRKEKELWERERREKREERENGLNGLISEGRKVVLTRSFDGSTSKERPTGQTTS